jgi:hypothetical protein
MLEDRVKLRSLLDNKLAPITFRFGFVECPFLQFADAFVSWQRKLDATFGTHTEVTHFNAPLAAALLRLEPLTTPLDRYLLAETRSEWSAIFSNGLRVNDVFSPVSYLAEVLRCRGLEIACTPDRSVVRRKDIIQPYGATMFSLYGPQKTDWLNRIRRISAYNEGDHWVFQAEGEIQSYEQAEHYQKRRIVDRFTPELLESYCGALGIEPFEEKFYGSSCLLAETIKRAAPLGPAMSIAEARSHLYL